MIKPDPYDGNGFAHFAIVPESGCVQLRRHGSNNEQMKIPVLNFHLELSYGKQFVRM